MKSILKFLWSTLAFLVMLLVAACLACLIPHALSGQKSGLIGGLVWAGVLAVAALGAFAVAIRFLPSIGMGIGALRRGTWPKNPAVSQSTPAASKGSPGFHDRLAERALDMGKRAADFKAVAQRNANNCWGWLLVAGLIGWFANGRWWVIPAAVSAWSAWQSLSATLIQVRLEKLEGTPESTE